MAWAFAQPSLASFFGEAAPASPLATTLGVASVSALMLGGRSAHLGDWLFLWQVRERAERQALLGNCFQKAWPLPTELLFCVKLVG